MEASSVGGGATGIGGGASSTGGGASSAGGGASSPNPLFLCPANAMYMAGQEMEEVLERDNVTIGRHLGKVGRQRLALDCGGCGVGLKRAPL